MLIPYQSLKKYLDFTQSIDQVADTLTMLGLEVDAIHTKSPDFSGVIIAKILNVQPVDNGLSHITITNGKEDHVVVTKAKNCRQGAFVPWAKPGALLYGKKIESKVFFKTVSKGLLLSMKELKLGEDHAGIWLIEGDVSVGLDLNEYFTQQVLEISLTPNLGHCQSIRGVARELSAAFSIPLKENPIASNIEPSDYKIHVESNELCPGYYGLFLDQIEIKPSSIEVVKELFALGQAAANNVVDAANLVMFEVGQPLHTFDANGVGKTLEVKQIEGKTTALDGKEYSIDSKDLVIVSDQKIVAIAGVIGSENSKVTNKTSAIFVESAAFDPTHIRKTAKRLLLRTQAAIRFEKGVDLNNLQHALELFASYLRIANLKISHQSIARKAKTVTLRPERCNEILGTSLAMDQIAELLKRLDFSVAVDKQNLIVTIPTYRNDMHLEIDLIEEVGRLYGYQNLPKQLPIYQLDNTQDDPLFAFERKVRSLLLRLQLQECITPDLIDTNVLKKIGYPIDQSMLVMLKESAAKQFNTLRPSIIPCLLEVANHNFAKGTNQLALFEMGKIHLKDQNRFFEPSMFTLLLAEKKAKKYHFDFFDVKGKCEALFQLLGIQIEFKPSAISTFHPHLQASIHAGNLQLGEIGMLHPAISENQLWFVECNIEDCMQAMPEEKKIEMPSIYPVTTRDLTLSINKKHTYQTILDFIQQQSTQFLQSTDFLNLYSPDEKTCNLTLRFIYQKQNGTIQFAEAQQEHDQLTKLLEKQFS